MPKYFMGDTRLAGLERMMMDPSRSEPFREKPRRDRPREDPVCGQTEKTFFAGQKPMEGCV